MPVLLRPVNNFLGQVIGNASEGKYNTVNNSSSGEVTFQKSLNSGITLFSSKNSNKSQTFTTGAYQRLHEARPRRVVWLWEPEYHVPRMNSPQENIYHDLACNYLLYHTADVSFDHVDLVRNSLDSHEPQSTTCAIYRKQPCDS